MKLVKRIVSLTLSLSLFSAMGIVVADSARAGQVNVLGATVTWDDNAMFFPEGCSNFNFNYFNGTGIRLLVLGFRIVDPFGGVIARDSQIGIPAGISGRWSEQICNFEVEDTGLSPYTLEVEIEDYVGSVRTGSAPFSFRERPVPLPSAPQSVQATVRDRDGVINWRAPGTNPTSVREYSVIDAGTGAEVCRVPANVSTCSVASLADGQHAFVVNALSAGNAPVASTPSATYLVGPPTTVQVPRVSKSGKSLKFVSSLNVGTTATPTQVVVKTGAGKAACSVKVTSQDVSKGFVTCLAKSPKAATRYSSTYVTSFGEFVSPLSPPRK